MEGTCYRSRERWEHAADDRSANVGSWPHPSDSEILSERQTANTYKIVGASPTVISFRVSRLTTCGSLPSTERMTEYGFANPLQSGIPSRIRHDENFATGKVRRTGAKRTFSSRRPMAWHSPTTVGFARQRECPNNNRDYFLPNLT